jgi:hypothetical protein
MKRYKANCLSQQESIFLPYVLSAISLFPGAEWEGSAAPVQSHKHEDCGIGGGTLARGGTLATLGSL